MNKLISNVENLSLIILPILCIALLFSLVFRVISDTRAISKCEKVTAYIPVSGKWITREVCLNE
jgi:hypothetical protein